jgi:hypothetical protein
MAAMWLVVAIAAVSLEFSLAARDRRVLGLAASDRGRQRAAVLGALATMQARMEYDLRNGPSASTTGVSGLRASDPWLDADSLYSGPVFVDSMPVYVVAHDLGMGVNINTIREADLRVMLGFVLGDATTADHITQSIMDWRDADDNPRPNGAERDQYLKDNLLMLPTNGAFREVDDLINVYGMTPDLLELIRPYVTTHASATVRVNLNTAPEPVLRSLQGITDQILNQILALRSSGRRITSVAQVMTATNRGRPVGGGGRGAPPTPQEQRLQATQTQLTNATTVNTTDVELTFIVRDSTRAQTTKLVAVISRAGTNQSNISWQLW